MGKGVGKGVGRVLTTEMTGVITLVAVGGEGELGAVSKLMSRFDRDLTNSDWGFTTSLHWSRGLLLEASVLQLSGDHCDHEHLGVDDLAYWLTLSEGSGFLELYFLHKFYSSAGFHRTVLAKLSQDSTELLEGFSG